MLLSRSARIILSGSSIQLWAHADSFLCSRCAESPSRYIWEQVITGLLFMRGMSPAARLGRSPKNRFSILPRIAAGQRRMRHGERRGRFCYRITRWSDDTLTIHHAPHWEYFETANIVDIRNLCRHGSPAMERPCKTKSWNLRLFQTFMGKCS